MEDQFSGFVRRKGRKHGLYHRRFLKLRGRKLYFFRSQDDPDPELELQLSKEARAGLLENNAPFKFVVKDPIFGEVIIVTETIEESQSWVAAINAAQDSVPNMSMDDFNILSVLGRGFYGKVMLVRHKVTGELFAIKSIQKNLLIEIGKAETVISERNILMKIKHPFIVHLNFAFQTKTKFYLGLEYVPGGELYYHMNKKGGFGIDDIRLYTAEILLALTHLHSLGIVYRDLKPENVLLDAQGHIRLTDFGLSKEICDRGSTNSFCGTIEYLAPEVVLQEDYSYPVDIWALGILVYEMITGRTPFFSESQQVLFNNIVNEEPTFSNFLDYRISGFISLLLNKNPKERPTLVDLQYHPFFSGIDFDKVLHKQYKPFFVPDIKDFTKPENFDTQFTDETPADSVGASLSDDIVNVPGFSYFDENY